jgi:hypothetical protein
MSFDSVCESNFPKALAEADFVRGMASALEPMGFNRNTAMACVASCRDEISQSWAEAATEVWGYPFCLTGLGGLILAGKTGFGAALSHAPNPGGRERYVFMAGPHIAIGEDGAAGVCSRPDRSGPSTACGALAAALKELQSGEIGPIDDADDVEIGWLRRRLGEAAAGKEIGNLFELTHLTHEVIAGDLERLLPQVVDTSTTDYAVATGIQIHAPGNKNMIQPKSFYAVINGERQEVTGKW